MTDRSPAAADLDPRTPVLVGVGACTGDDEPVRLMATALEAAADDAGALSLLGHVDRIAVPQGLWSYPDPARLVAGLVGAPRARTHLGEVGISQQTLVSQALRAIVSGESDVAVVAGGEARARARRAELSGTAASETAQGGVTPDVVHRREPDFVAAAEVAAGLVVPVQQYAIIDNALGAAEGTSPADVQRDVAQLWARFNAVAGTNPCAAFPAPMTARDIAEVSESNRPLAYPYNKWHASQWTVDQAAALLLCSVGWARAQGVATDRWVFPLVGVDANHSVSLSARRWLHRWPAMGVLGRVAEERIGRALADVELSEVYSCFPSAVRVQQRELGLPLDGTPTVTGGMAFAGGPFNNFTYQATAAMVPKLREAPRALGVVTTVCGLLTKPGLAVWSATPDARPPLVDDLAVAAADATPVLEVVAGHRGPARVASFTVTFDGTQPDRVAVVADIAAGVGGSGADTRCVAVSHDADLAAAAVRDGLIGATVAVDGSTFTR